MGQVWESIKGGEFLSEPFATELLDLPVPLALPSVRRQLKNKETHPMASDRLVTPSHVLRAMMEYQRCGRTKLLSELEKLEPDLMEYLLENLSRLYHDLTHVGLSQRDARRLHRHAEKMAVVCIVALRNAHRELWEADPPDSPPP